MREDVARWEFEQMLVHYVEDDQTFGRIVSDMFLNDGDIDIVISSRISDVVGKKDILETDFFLLDVNRPDTISLDMDVETLRRLSPAPIAFVTSGDAAGLRSRAMQLGAEAVLDKSEFSAGLIRQVVFNARARFLARIPLEPEAGWASDAQMMALHAPLNYLEAGLSTLRDVMRDTGRHGAHDFVDHMRETIVALKQYSEDDLSQQSVDSLDRLIEQSNTRIRRFAASRQIGLRLDWEAAGFHRIGSDALARLGVQHLLEGILRCGAPGDGVWMHGEKSDQDGSSVLQVHMSRRILSASDVLFPGGKASPAIGLDAISSLQLGALLLMLTPQQVKLANEGRHQMLSVYL